jgi:hypothetical protein
MSITLPKYLKELPFLNEFARFLGPSPAMLAGAASYRAAEEEDMLDFAFDVRPNSATVVPDQGH